MMQEDHNIDWFRERHVGLMLPKSFKQSRERISRRRDLRYELLTFDPPTLNHVEISY